MEDTKKNNDFEEEVLKNLERSQQERIALEKVVEFLKKQEEELKSETTSKKS